jgi:hypothetical protein
LTWVWARRHSSERSRSLARRPRRPPSHGDPLAACCAALCAVARYEAGGYTATDKDTVENRLKREVCGGDLSLADARWWIVNDWRDAP